MFRCDSVQAEPPEALAANRRLPVAQGGPDEEVVFVWYELLV